MLHVWGFFFFFPPVKLLRSSWDSSALQLPLNRDNGLSSAVPAWDELSSTQNFSSACCVLHLSWFYRKLSNAQRGAGLTVFALNFHTSCCLQTLHMFLMNIAFTVLPGRTMMHWMHNPWVLNPWVMFSELDILVSRSTLHQCNNVHFTMWHFPP